MPFACRVDWERLPSDPNYDCISLFNMCGTAIATWGVGGKAFFFPPEAGLPFDQYMHGYSYSNKYLLLQVRLLQPKRSEILLCSLVPVRALRPAQGLSVSLRLLCCLGPLH